MKQKGHILALLPELNTIEHVWAQLKCYTKAHCKFLMQPLRKNVPDSYDTVTLGNVKNHFRKVRHFMFAYLEGLKRECRAYNLVIGRGRQRATGAYKRGRALPEVIQAASNGGRIQIHERSFSLLGAFTLSVYPRVSAVYT